MRLKNFRVRTYRNIVDSGPIDVDHVTCLVGKNEAGKSALLQALHQLNPAKPAATLDLLEDYPRWLKKKHEISGEIQNAVPITATFEFTDAELESLAARFGEHIVSGPTVDVSRAYGAARAQVDVPIDVSGFVSTFLAESSERLRGALGVLTTTDALIKGLEKLVAARDEANAASVALASDAESDRGRLTELIGPSSLTAAVKKAILDMVPKTFYFSTYSQLRGRYTLEEVFNAVQSGSDDEEIQAAADFLQLARVVPDTIAEWDYEASNAELESISSLLTSEVKDLWRQNDHLKLRVNLEAQQVNTPAGATVRRFLQFRVEDTRHDFSSRLDRRSTGFQWFVSFIASFLEFNDQQDLILLLDEPGLSLHARAQMDLLDTIENKLASRRQVLYSTHSPFLVRPTALSHVRVTEDQGPVLGSVVVNEAGIVNDPDTLFPLQAALGYDVVQNLFIGDRNVLVEGISDFIYLTALSDHLSSIGRSSFPEGTRLMPAGGATNIPTFIALLGGKLAFVVLLDGSTDKQRIESAISRGRVDGGQIVSLDDHSTVSRADIEDLFTPGEYLALYNATFGKALKVGDLPGTDRIVQRIARVDGGEFNHGVVASQFLRTLDKSIASLSEGTLDRFESTIAALVGALPDR